MILVLDLGILVALVQHKVKHEHISLTFMSTEYTNLVLWQLYSATELTILIK